MYICSIYIIHLHLCVFASVCQCELVRPSLEYTELARCTRPDVITINLMYGCRVTSWLPWSLRSSKAQNLARRRVTGASNLGTWSASPPPPPFHPFSYVAFHTGQQLQRPSLLAIRTAFAPYRNFARDRIE